MGGSKEWERGVVVRHHGNDSIVEAARVKFPDNKHHDSYKHKKSTRENNRSSGALNSPPSSWALDELTRHNDQTIFFKQGWA